MWVNSELNILKMGSTSGMCTRPCWLYTVRIIIMRHHFGRVQSPAYRKISFHLSARMSMWCLVPSRYCSFTQERQVWTVLINRSTLYVGDTGQHKDDEKDLLESARKSDRSFKRKREHKEQNHSPSPDLEEGKQSLRQQIREHKSQGPLFLSIIVIRNFSNLHVWD